MGWTTEWTEVDKECKFSCVYCGEFDVYFRKWESSDEAHEDICYDCKSCQHLWWVEGSDY